MKNYVIIDADAIQKKIDELEKELKYLKGGDAYVTLGEINSLNKVLSQSIPLIPEIEKAFDAGKICENRLILKDEGYDLDSYNLPKIDSFEDYITNLKLDI